MKNIITKDSFDNFVNTSKPEEINGALYDVTAINHCLDKGFNTGYIKGAKNSQHLTGQACDFIIQGMPVEEVIKKINQSGIEYDQLINERTWVHISFNKGHNRKQCFSI